MPDRPFEREGLVRQAVKIALENDHTAAALRAYGNLGHTLYTRDRIDEAISTQRDAVALARRRGDRNWEWFAVANLVEFLVAAGDWSEAVAIASDMPEEARHGALSFPIETLIWLHVERGDLAEAAELGRLLDERERADEDPSYRAYGALAESALARADGRLEDALVLGGITFDEFIAEGEVLPAMFGIAEAARDALALDDLATADSLLARCADLPPVFRSRSIRSQEARLQACLAVRRGRHEEVEPGFRTAAAGFREIGLRFWLAVTLLEHGEWLVGGQSRVDDAEPLLAEAHEIFDRLEARPWLERLDAVQPHTEALAG